MSNSMNFPIPEPSLAKSSNLADILSQKVVGQAAVMQCIVPYVQMYQAGLATAGRPAGVFLLLGPTGTGKTRTVEVLAETLHGNAKSVVKVNCGEFQMDHEVAKLIGAPPGYTGFRESESPLSQAKIVAATSVGCDLAIVLFDEVEKAAPSLTQLLLGILDKATLRLGDGADVDFEKTLIFFTSNLGAREMLKEMHPDLGFRQTTHPSLAELSGRLESVSLAAVRRKFSPEFINRIDAVVTYQPLDPESFAAILDLQIVELQNHVNSRLGDKGFEIVVSDESRQFLLKRGTSVEYGARELKRVIHRNLTQPLATLVIEGKIPAGGRVNTTVNENGDALLFEFTQPPADSRPKEITILIVDDNSALLDLLSHHFRQMKARIVTAESVGEAMEIMTEYVPDVALLDVMLPDGNGVRLGVQLKLKKPNTHVIVMTGAELAHEQREICEEYGFDFLPKPFLVDQAVRMIQERMSSTKAAGGGQRPPG